MKSLENNMRLYMVAVLFIFTCVILPAAHAQSVTASPGSLSFGVPTGTPSPYTSAPGTVTLNITGSGTVTFAAVPTPPFTVSSGSPFTVIGDSCQGALTAPTTCQVSFTFSSNLTSLQKDTFSISATGSESGAIALNVPLSGAFGAIKLFDEVNVAASNASATLTSPVTYGSAPLALSCPVPSEVSTPNAVLSSTPDGNGYVLEDNYVSLAINAIPVSSGFNPPGNVCTGGPNDGNSLNDCFSTNYQVPAGGGQLNGQNPDTFANPGNAVLALQGGNANNAGGVLPINISNYFSAGGNIQATFTLLDGGGYVAGATLFLHTNCSLAGIAPGGSITGNPVTSNTSSQTQTFTFNNAPNQNISYTTSTAGSGVTATGVIPIVTDIGISQVAFSNLINGTSAAPAVCLRLSGELDPSGATLCKGYLIQCYDPATNTTTGDNCTTAASAQRLLFDSAQFTSPDAPSGQNFLLSSCNNFVHSTKVSLPESVRLQACREPIPAH